MSTPNPPGGGGHEKGALLSGDFVTPSGEGGVAVFFAKYAGHKECRGLA